MNPSSNASIKVVSALIEAKTPLRLVELPKRTGLAKSHVLFHLKKLIEDGIVIHVGNTYACQPYLTNEDKDDLVALMGVMVSLVTKDLVVTEQLTVEELGRRVQKNVELFLQLYKEGLFG